MKKNLKTWLCLIMVALLALSCIACTSSQEPASEPQDAQDAAEAPAADSNAPAAEEPAAQDDSRTLRVAVSGDTETLDPHVGNLPHSTEAIANLYDQLFTYEIVEDANGNLVGDSSVVIGSLAESWELDETGKIYTITIRDDVYFHSGNHMTTEDVYYSFDRALNSGAGTGAFDMSVITVTDVIEIVDDYTFKMYTEETNPYALNVLQMGGCSIVDSAVFKENATEDDPWALEWAGKNEAGSGPYKLKSWDAGVELVFEANKDYWGYDVYFDEMVWSIIPEYATQVMMMANGELDVIKGVTANYLSELEAANVNIMSFDSKNQLTLYMNSVKGGPFADKYVRQAMAYAIPYQDIVEFVYYGNAQVCDSVIPVGSPNYDNSAWKYSYDIEAAKATLAQSGYADGFSFTLAISNAYPTHESIAILIQDALAQIGVTMEIQKLDNSAFDSNRETADAYLNESLAWVDDPSYILDLSLVDIESATNARIVNYTYNQEFLDLVEESNYMLDQEQRTANYNRIQALCAEDVPIICICQPDYNLVVSEGITGYVQYFDELVRFGRMSR